MVYQMWKHNMFIVILLRLVIFLPLIFGIYFVKLMKRRIERQEIVKSFIIILLKFLLKYFIFPVCFLLFRPTTAINQSCLCCHCPQLTSPSPGLVNDSEQRRHFTQALISQLSVWFNFLNFSSSSPQHTSHELKSRNFEIITFKLFIVEYFCST